SLTGYFDGASNTVNDASTALVTHPGLIFSMGGNPVTSPASNGLPNARIDDVAFWNGWASPSVAAGLFNGSYTIYNAPIIDPISPPPPSVDPHPIMRDASNNFFINRSASFQPSDITLEVRRFARIPDSGGLARPRLNALRHAPGVEGVFVVDEGLSSLQTPATGAIYHVTDGGQSVINVLNIGSVLPVQQTGMLGQGGVRSLAFHPQFSQPGAPGYGKLYTTQVLSRTGQGRGGDSRGPKTPPLNTEGGFPNTSRFDGVLGEWTATFDAQGRFSGIDAGSFRQIFRIATPSTQHPIKQISFNPLADTTDEDYGLLYVLHGDGVNSFSQGTGLNGGDALGKVLRIDPLQQATGRYAVPPTNPFVGNPSVLDEVFTLGHRNVHQIAFSRDSGGSLQIFVSEIGQESVDAINPPIPRAREGTFTRVGNGIGPLPTTADGYTYPVAQYGHIEPGGNAIVGGYVTDNGSPLDGYYFFGDFSNGDKPMFAISVDDAAAAVTQGNPAALAPVQPRTVSLVFDHDDNPLTPPIPKASFLDIVNDEATYDGSGRTDLRFGQGPQGELYLINKRNGWIYLVTNSLPFAPADFNQDRVVDGADLEIWAAHFGVVGTASNAQGDANLDQSVDGADFIIWQRQLSGATSLESMTLQIPEPSGAALTPALFWLVAFRKKRDRSSQSWRAFA
ncbi:MAG TPA: PQQ-dependent sugar dehydrogenase, partial [Lacipirellulaceae bacterium]|nr:PQQ-dependent sugar dehydrogenase [Lacipirellulaceae bacterium]